MSSTQIKKVRAWHEELVEFMLAHPRASLVETSMYFNASISWISIVKNSDAFQELWHKRRNEHFSTVSSSVSERVTALADMTVDALSNKLEKEIKAETASIDTLKEVGDMALKALGFGARGNVGVSIHAPSNRTTNIFVDKDTLAQAREARLRMQVIEGEARKIEEEKERELEEKNGGSEKLLSFENATSIGGFLKE